MRTLTLTTVGISVTVLSLTALLTRAGNSGGPGGRSLRAGDPASRPGNRPDGGFCLIPPFAVEKMKLTDEQRKKLDDLTKETQAKLNMILTADQQKILREARPPRPDRGREGADDGPGERPGDAGPGPQDGPPPVE